MLENLTRVVQIGKLHITLPALVTAVCGLVIGVLMPLQMRKILSPMAIALYSLFTTLFVVYISYVINCTVVGHCNILAVVWSSVYFVYATLLVVGLGVKYIGGGIGNRGAPSSSTKRSKRK